MSISSISLETANTIYAWSWIGLLIGALLTLFGTAAAFWSSAIRDKYSDERTATLESTTEKAKLEQVRINEINLRLQIDLERERAARIKIEGGLASRRISPEQCMSIMTHLSGVQIPQTLVVTQSDEEQSNYARQIHFCL